MLRVQPWLTSQHSTRPPPTPSPWVPLGLLSPLDPPQSRGLEGLAARRDSQGPPQDRPCWPGSQFCSLFAPCPELLASLPKSSGVPTPPPPGETRQTGWALPSVSLWGQWKRQLEAGDAAV